MIKSATLLVFTLIALCYGKPRSEEMPASFKISSAGNAISITDLKGYWVNEHQGMYLVSGVVHNSNLQACNVSINLTFWDKRNYKIRSVDCPVLEIQPGEHKSFSQKARLIVAEHSLLPATIEVVAR